MSATVALLGIALRNNLEILGYSPGLLNRLIYLRKIGDLSGGNLI